MIDHPETLEPIPVKLGRWRMRSTLEARWGLVLAHLGVPWRYEPRLWDLPSGRYLPDFQLPEHGAWVEIKPDGIPIDDRRYRELAALGETLVLLVGSPWPGDYTASLYTAGQVEEGLRLALGRRNPEELWLCRIGDGFTYPLSPRVNGDDFPLFQCATLERAFRAARNALFEPIPQGGR